MGSDSSFFNNYSQGWHRSASPNRDTCGSVDSQCRNKPATDRRSRPTKFSDNQLRTKFELDHTSNSERAVATWSRKLASYCLRKNPLNISWITSKSSTQRCQWGYVNQTFSTSSTTGPSLDWLRHFWQKYSHTSLYCLRVTALTSISQSWSRTRTRQVSRGELTNLSLLPLNTKTGSNEVKHSLLSLPHGNLLSTINTILQENVATRGKSTADVSWHRPESIARTTLEIFSHPVQYHSTAACPQSLVYRTARAHHQKTEEVGVHYSA